jgi:type I restriction-modification system DNA methylase subunit
MVKKEINNYLKEIMKTYLDGDYTEFTFRTSLENLIKSLNPDYNLTQEPRRIVKLGAPDFKAFSGSRKVGSIETKNLGENLEEIFKSEQIKKYIQSIDNIILTDYTRFILIRNGQIVNDLNLFYISDLKDVDFSIADKKIEAFMELIGQFFNYKIQSIKTAEELAKELSKKAKLLKDIVKKQLTVDIDKEKNQENPSAIYDFYVGINGLIKDISIEDCADAYAQTVTYSLFLARKNSQSELNRESAYTKIPKNIGIIKRIFINISADEFPSNVSWIIDDIVDILNASDLDKIFSGIDSRGKTDKDPIIFLYEDFLNFYEPEKKKNLGVYYTPRPVVNFIVNSMHLLLKEHFDKPTGFADDTVTVLDPATGTGTFFWITYLVVLNELVNQGLKGLIKDKIHNHLLKNFYGFEILITAYVIAHLKLSDLLQQWYYRFQDDDKIQIFLTNTLEPPEHDNAFIPFFREINEENRATAKIKSEEPIIAIMGNPPYSGMSANKGK